MQNNMLPHIPIKGAMSPSVHYTSSYLSSALKRLSLTSFILVVCCTLSFIPLAHAKKEKEKENKFKVTVLQNKEHNRCMFMDEVIISVKYKMRSMDKGALTAEISEDGRTFYKAASLDIERGQGKVIMTFDAGPCATDMRIVVE